MTVPYTFGTATTSIPLSNLDANFNTPITLGNTSIYLGNTTTTIGNLTLTNATISSGNVTLTNVSVTTANVTNITVTGTANIATGNVTTLTSTSITDSGLTSGRVTFAGASGLLSDSATFVFNGTSFGVGTTNPVATQQIKGSGTSGQVTASWILENSSSGTGGMDITGSPGASRWRFLYGGGPSTGTNALTEAMCILTEGASSGNVGIGTSSPNSKLTVTGGQTRILSSTAFVANPLDNNSWSGAVTVNTNDGAGDLSGLGMYVNSTYGAGCGIFAKQTSSTTADLTFFTGSGVGASNIERMRIDSSGNLLVGKTATDVTTAGTQLESTGTVGITRDSATNLILNRKTSDGTIVSIRRDNTEVGSISATTTLTSYNVTSDYRLKENIAPMTGALAKVAQLKPVTYKWKLNGSDGQGFIAHELAEVVPDCVTGEKDAIDEDGKPQYQAMDTSHLVATLVSAIQEQQALIESLTTRLTALENK